MLPLLDHVGAPMMDAAFAALAPRPGETVLDLGVGGGALGRRLLKAGARLVAVDPAPEVLAAARRALPGAEVLAGRAEAIPLPDAAVDAVASVNSLYFWAALEPAFAEIARVLRPGGRLVLGFQTAQAVKAWPGHVHGFRAWETAAVEAAVAGAGLRVRAVHPGHDRRVGAFRTLVADRG